MALKKILGLERKLTLLGTLGALSTAIPTSVLAQDQPRGPPPVTAEVGFESFSARRGEAADQYRNRWFSQFRARLFQVGKFHFETGLFLDGTNRLFVQLPDYVRTFHEHFGASIVYSHNSKLFFNFSLIRFNTEIMNSPLEDSTGGRPSGGAYNALSSGVLYFPNDKTSLTAELSFQLLSPAYIGRTRTRLVARTKAGPYNIEASLHRIEHGSKQQTYYKPFYPWRISVDRRIPGTIVDLDLSYGDMNVLDLQENKPQPRNVPLRTLTIGVNVKAPYSSRNP